MTYLSPADVKERYGIGRSQLNQLVAAGRIVPAIDPGRPGQARYYTAEEIEQYLKSRGPQGPKRTRHPEPKGAE